MSHLTTHVLDTAKGRPAAGIGVSLFRPLNNEWEKIAVGITDNDGRIPHLLKNEDPLPPGIYKLYFDVKSYLENEHRASFYPFIEIVFTITGVEHYHVPLLLNPFGYTTYRGS